MAAYTDAAGKFEPGAPNNGNEDNFHVHADLGQAAAFEADREVALSVHGCLMVGADGMGGMNAGEVASEIAVATVARCFTPERLADCSLGVARERERYLERVVAEADREIRAAGKREAAYAGMGSTIVLAWLWGEELSVTWCGDSRAYVLREPEGLRQITKDHSFVQQLVDVGELEEFRAFDHPYNNIITRSLGDPEGEAEPSSRTVAVAEGDIVLLCSDGLNGVLRDRKTLDDEGNVLPGENLEEIMRNNRATMQGCREALWRAAEAAGWYDNVTAILCEIVSGGGTEREPVEAEAILKTKEGFGCRSRKRWFWGMLGRYIFRRR